MHRSFLVLPIALLLTAACTPDVTITDVAACDGILQSQEDTVDDAFDRDLDGYFDGNNPGCQATYPAEDLDCDDANPDANPIATEIECNDRDDDCNPETSDLDERGCVESYSGTWAMDSSVALSCALGNVNINFNQLVVTHTDPSIIMTAIGSGVQPGSLNGSITPQGVFSLTSTISGGCTETYDIDGSFTSPNTLDGTFTADFQGGMACIDCSFRSWNFTATR